ncbi:hypothetical protein GGS23DRAFT_560681 [Durotheca rogersii]|uniref:uncharacterized protein n=1 Tax=Durotheca rogersii TaxID=419775 RepID=UPI00221F18B0|nr:uncharacterized protein GGS23DRAFT_560681 [Durotheca rogersii]KAI5864549.1 hypothetical protein GGS23DRAFT_560681 [Durotheca rogersii]
MDLFLHAQDNSWLQLGQHTAGPAPQRQPIHCLFTNGSYHGHTLYSTKRKLAAAVSLSPDAEFSQRGPSGPFNQRKHLLISCPPQNRNDTLRLRMKDSRPIVAEGPENNHDGSEGLRRPPSLSLSRVLSVRLAGWLAAGRCGNPDSARPTSRGRQANQGRFHSVKTGGASPKGDDRGGPATEIHTGPTVLLRPGVQRLRTFRY